MGPGCQLAVGCPAEAHALHKARRGPRSQPPLHLLLQAHTNPFPALSHLPTGTPGYMCAHRAPEHTQWSAPPQGVWETRTRTHSIPGQAWPTLTSVPHLPSSKPAPDRIGRSGGGPKPPKALWPTGKQASPLRTTSPWALDTADPGPSHSHHHSHLGSPGTSRSGAPSPLSPHILLYLHSPGQPKGSAAPSYRSKH